MKSKPAPGKMLTTAEMLPKTVDKINLAHLLDKLLHQIHTQKHTHACTHTRLYLNSTGMDPIPLVAKEKHR